MEMQPVGHEQDAARPFPDRLEPSSLSARMEQRRAMAMLGKATDPSLNLVAIEWRIQPRPAKPLLTETVVAFGIIDASAIPRARVGSGRIEIERAEHLDDPARRDVNLGLADAGLMRSQRHGAARRRHSGMSSPSPARGSTATSPTRALNFSRAPCDAQSHARSRLRSSLSSPSSSHWGLRTAFNSPTSPRSAMFWNSKCVSWACSSSLRARSRSHSPALSQHLRRNWGRLRRGLPCGLLAALAVGPDLDVGNFPTSLLLRSDRCDRLVIDLDRIRDLPVRLRRVGLDQLRDQFVLLLAGQMAAVNVRADDEGIGIDRAVEYNHLVDGEKILACHNARRADNCRTDLDLNGVKPTAAVK